jgi:ATP-dependent RNA helicase DDX41
MIGIAFTGSGKTLAFCLPVIMTAVEEESKLPFVRGEGPVGVILCPSRELANQTYENVLAWTDALAQEKKYPRLNTLLCIGGISMGEQSHVLNKGLHIVVATPGRLIDMLEKKRFTFNNCKYLVMDEADRMIDLGFEDDVRNILSFFRVCHFASLVFACSWTSCSIKDKLYSSPLRCRGKSRILHKGP